MSKVKWLDGEPRIQVEPPKRPKKCTGTRFAAVLGLDQWTTPFQAWCAITRTFESPFEDNKYTIAGKTIEPKVAQYLKDMYFGEENVILPTDVYGENPFKKTYGDFFKDVKVFGGMWDALLYENGKPIAVIEQKTTGRAESWTDGAPIHYAYQAALYAYLKGLDEVYMVVTVLEDKDYISPDDFVPSAQNTSVDHFKISERFPHFEDDIQKVLTWWKEHVETGTSPYYDERKDADALKSLRTNNVEVDDRNIKQHLARAEALQRHIAQVKQSIEDEEKELKTHEDAIKTFMGNQFRAGDSKVELTGNQFKYTLSKTYRTSIDTQKLKEDGVYQQYAVETESLRLTKSEVENG